MFAPKVLSHPKQITMAGKRPAEGRQDAARLAFSALSCAVLRCHVIHASFLRLSLSS